MAVSDPLPRTLADTPSAMRRPASLIVSQEQAVALTQKLCQPVIECPSILRGVHPSFLLERLGFWIRTGPIMNSNLADRNHLRSFMVPKLSTFLSHSWHAPGRRKAVACLNHWNGIAAVMVGLLFSIACVVVGLLDWLPPMVVDMKIGSFVDTICPGGPQIGDFYCWCTISYLVGYCCTLCWWQHLLALTSPTAPAATFLDKLCIYQGDSERKAKGISAIGAFLIQSQEMLIMWDTTYFTRAWCVFELAVFLILNPTGRLLLKPIATGFAEVFVQITFTLAYLALICPLASFGILQTLISYLMMLGLPSRFVLPLVFILCWPLWLVAALAQRPRLRSEADLLGQIERFSLIKAKCFDPRDRAFILDTVKEIYGSVEAFDEFARLEIHKQILQCSGSVIQLPYWNYLRISTPLFVFWVFDVGLLTLKNATYRYRCYFILGLCTVCSLHMPVMVYVFVSTLTVRLSVTSKFEDVLVSAVLAIALGIILAAWIAMMPLILSDSVMYQVVSVVVGLVAVRACWFSRFGEGERERERLTHTHGRPIEGLVQDGEEGRCLGNSAPLGPSKDYKEPPRPQQDGVAHAAMMAAIIMGL